METNSIYLQSIEQYLHSNDDHPFPLFNQDHDINHDILMSFENAIQEPSLSDLLPMAAEAVESGNWDLASNLIARLEQQYLLFDSENETSPFFRLASLFTKALRSRAIGDHRPIFAPISTNEEMSAYQMVQELSPFVKFAHFTANQAILEAVGLIEGDQEVHIIDFDVMEGIQWPPLMVDLVNINSNTPLRITAIVTDANADIVLRTGQRLIEFAESIGLSLRFDQLEVKDLETLQVCKRSVVANCCVAQQSKSPSQSLASMRTFLTNVRKLTPKMVVLVEEELLRSTKTSSMSFVDFFCEALHHFSSIYDSLCCSFHGGYKNIGLRLVENEMLGPSIMDYVENFPFGPLNMEGLELSPLSHCNVSQAKYLLGLFSRGFGVQYENGRLSLCWKSRAIITTSLWLPT